MITVNSLSGGKTSSYMAAHYPADFDVFALVRIESCRFPDEVLRRRVEDRLQAEFIGTAEDDTIIYTMFDLEQHIGREIIWVTGPTFDKVAGHPTRWLPNALRRYCTVEMKINPIRTFCKSLAQIVDMRIGFRANEQGRAQNLLAFDDQKKWRQCTFPLIDAGVYNDQIESYWEPMPVRFATRNNCVGCFHRNPMLLNQMAQDHPDKMEWFASQERPGKSGKIRTWRSDITYRQAIDFKPQLKLKFDDFTECDSGQCGI